MEYVRRKFSLLPRLMGGGGGQENGDGQMESSASSSSSSVQDPAEANQLEAASAQLIVSEINGSVAEGAVGGIVKNGSDHATALWSEEPDQSDEDRSSSVSSGTENVSVGGNKITRCRSHGTITALDENFKGVINGKYVFNPRHFQQEGIRFKFGDKVTFTAEQDVSVDCSWKVKTICRFISETNKQVQERLEFTTVNCEIKKMDSEGNVHLEGSDGRKFTINKDKLPKEYDSQVGDWLTVTLKIESLDAATSNMEARIELVKPTNQKKQHLGLLKRKHVGHQYSRRCIWCVDDRVFVDEKLISGHVELRHGCNVTLEMIESHQGEYKWRAISLKPSKYKEFSQFRTDDDETVSANGTELNEFITRQLRGKEGISINDTQYITEFGDISVGGWKEKIFTIENSTSTQKHVLKNVELKYDESVVKFELKLPARESKEILAVIEPQQSIVIKLTATPKLVGKTMDLIWFDFGNFKIVRKINIYAKPADEETLKVLMENRAYNNDNGGRRHGHRNSRNRAYNDSVKKRREVNSRDRVRGAQAVRQAFFGSKRLPSYRIPKAIEEAYHENLTTKLFEEFPSLACTTLPENITLTFENYKDCFQAALWMEEVEHGIRNEKLTAHEVQLYRASDETMYFSIPNIDGSNIQAGQSIAVFDPSNSKAKVFDSQIIRISERNVFARFDESLSREYVDQPMTVQFKVPRTTFRRWHHAIVNAVTVLGKDWLFPEKVEVRLPRFTIIEDPDEDNSEEIEVPEPVQPVPYTNLVKVPARSSKIQSLQRIYKRNELDMREVSVHGSFKRYNGAQDEILEQQVKLKWFNKLLNREQRDAVRRILRGQCRPLPFIIYGPPGTGKTVTLIEAIMQVHKLMKHARILVTAPTNAAVDLITEYLIDSVQYSPGVVTRLLGFSRALTSVPKKIEAYCVDANDLKSVIRCSILVTTTNSAAFLFESDISEDHFSHVFIDEAGCCFEPDGIIPSLFVNTGHQGQLIMAGDHKQLGPFVQSDTAKYWGLGVSFLQRLMETKLYSSSAENDMLVTKLVKNYRSHEAILRMPSQLFYEDTLEFMAPKAEGEELMAKLHDMLPRPAIPLIFHAVDADECQDRDSCSWYNPMEVLVVVDYVRELLGYGCSPQDIGIITPYKKQVDKIRIAIERDLKCELPKIGSVEVFQGDERKIIILSLVRSFDTDPSTPFQSAKLTFVFSERRTNVSLTRARCLQILVGNPDLFCQSPIWDKYIRYCIDQGVYRGELPFCKNPNLQAQYAEERDKPAQSNGADYFSGEDDDEDVYA